MIKNNSIKNSVILKYDSQVPRYTSYPAAPHFNTAINSASHSTWLNNLPSQEKLSLYIHIPFCQQLCWYCGCYTKITQRYAPIENYAHILAREIKIVANTLGKKKRKVSHIHFGGGSPTILLPETFVHLMKTINSAFIIEKNAEIAIEVDPRNINEEKVSTYVKMGVNRASIGVQDFNPDVQKAINREQSFDIVYDCVKLFRKLGINNINLDLIYGLPKQTVEMIQKNIDHSLLLKPNRIAFFAYAHVQWKKKHMRLINDEDLPNNKVRLEMYQVAAKKLQQNNFISIGLDHFAHKNDSMTKSFTNKELKRNFQGYSSDTANNIIGLGASSISYFENFGYTQNALDFQEYENNILGEKLATIKGIAFSEEDKIRKKIIHKIMCYLEVDLKDICAEFSLPPTYFAEEIALLKNLKKDQLVTLKDNLIKIHPEAPQITRLVSSIFDKFFQPEAKKHSKAI